MNLPVGQAMSLLKETLNASKESKLSPSPPPMPEIVLSPWTVSMKLFQAWCTRHKGQTVKITTAPKEGTTFVVEADKVTFDERLRYCTLPTKPASSTRESERRRIARS